MNQWEVNGGASVSVWCMVYGIWSMLFYGLGEEGARCSGLGGFGGGGGGVTLLKALQGQERDMEDVWYAG